MQSLRHSILGSQVFITAGGTAVQVSLCAHAWDSLGTCLGAGIITLWSVDTLVPMKTWWIRAGAVAHGQSACLACGKCSVPSPPPQKTEESLRREQQSSGQPGILETMFQKAKPKTNAKSCPMVYFFLSSLPLSSPPFLHLSFTFSPPLLASFFLSNQGGLWTLGDPAASAYGVLRSQFYTVLPSITLLLKLFPPCVVSLVPRCPVLLCTCIITTCYSPEFWQGSGISCVLCFDYFCLFLLTLGPLPPCFLSSSLSPPHPPPWVLPVLSRCQVFNLLACLSFIDLFLTHRCLPAPGWLSVPEPRQRWNSLAAACLDGCQVITSPGERGRPCFPRSRM